MTADEAGISAEQASIAEYLGGHDWMITRVGDKWLITPIEQTYEVASLREAELFADGFTEGWANRDDLDRLR
jgi:hypothetical protein